MTDNKYIIKKLVPWMVDELIAFSEMTTFDVIFLRKQDDFYEETIEKLKSNNINIYTKPNAMNNILKKIFIAIKFLFSNLSKFRFDFNGVIGLKSIFWFLKLDLSKFSPNTKIHTQFATQGAVVSLLIKKYFNNEPEYSFTFHAHDIYFNNRWFNLLVNESYRSFSISEYNIKYVNEKYLFSDKIKLSRLGVFRDPLKKDKKVVNLHPEVMKIGVISWFVEKKGIQYLLEALLELKNRGVENIELILAGEGPLKNQFLSFIDENDLNDMVNYIGKIKGTEKQEFFQNIDVFILPCIALKIDKDGIPVVLMEATAASLPLISTNVSGIPEICFNDVNGILIEQRNVKEIVDAIIFMIENKDKRHFYAKNSLKISEEYDIMKNSSEKYKMMNWKQK